MNCIGIHDGHNATVALVKDGKVTYALSEERLVRDKNAGGFPRKAFKRLLRDCALTMRDIDVVAFGMKKEPQPEWYEKEKIMKRYKIQCEMNFKQPSLLYVAGRAIKKLLRGTRLSGKGKERFLGKRAQELKALGVPPEKVKYFDHHLSHAASAYYASGMFDRKVLCLTSDGGGDGLCATVNCCEHGRIERLAAIEQKHSIASLYGRTTFLMGMVPLEHEYKIMGMAPYGNTRRAQPIADALLKRFEFKENEPLIWKKKDEYPPTIYWGEYLKELFYLNRFDVIATALQMFVEDMTITWVRNCIKATGMRTVALAGGLFMNVKLNGKILAMPEVDEVFIMPSCSDDSTAIGAAYLAASECENEQIMPLKDLYLGCIYDDVDIKKAIDNYRFTDKVDVKKYVDIEDKVAGLLAQGEIVARYNGREEFGARALGNRSILADPSRLEVITRINKMIKNRDFWMPFAGSMTEDQSGRNLVNPKNHYAPYMMMTFDTKDDASEYPASRHQFDGTMRTHVISENWNKSYYQILRGFQEKTGKKGGILNTSFNLHGYPIVSSPDDALDVFARSGLSHLAIGSYLISKCIPSV